MVTRTKSKWDGKDINTLNDMEGYPLIFREVGSATRQSMENYFANRGFSFKKKLELTSNEAVKQAVMAGLGCSIMPLIGIRKELSDGFLRSIPLEGLPIKTDWQLVWLEGKKLSPVATAFAEYARQNKEKIAAAYF
jgi:DNA-binding transcriptional LysR family regulator